MARRSCCNPFDIQGHYWSIHGKNLKPVTERMGDRAPYLSVGTMICNTCRKKVSKMVPPQPVLLSLPNTPSQDDSVYFPEAEPLYSINECLKQIGETPYSRRRARGKNYPGEKLKKITEAMQ